MTTDANGVLSQVFDPVLSALRVSSSGGSSTPSGPAAGDLAGTYPNPTLAVIGSATGPLGTALRVPVVTIDTKGRVTALTDVAIALGATGDATGTLPGALTLANSGVTANTYGDASHIPVFTVDAKGRVTSVTSTAISAAGSGPFIDTTSITAPAPEYVSFDSNISLVASGSNFTVVGVMGYLYSEPYLAGSGASAPYTRTVQVKYTSGSNYIEKFDGTAFIAGDVGATVPSGSGIPAATTITGLTAGNTQATVSNLVTENKASISKVFSRGTSATGYTGTAFVPTLGYQYGIYVPSGLNAATANYAAYLGGTIFAADGAITAPATSHVFGESALVADFGVTLEASGVMHVHSSTLGLSYVATNFSGVASSLDLRSTRGTSFTSVGATQSGDALGAIHIGGDRGATAGSTLGVTLVDCAAIYAKATQNFGTSAYGTAWEFYTTPNSTVTAPLLAFKIGQDKKITVYGSVNASSGSLITDAGLTMTGALSGVTTLSMSSTITGATNVVYSDGTVSSTVATAGQVTLRFDAVGATTTGDVGVVFQGEKYTAGLAAMAAGDALGRIVWAGQYDTTVGHFANGAQILAVAEATFASTTNRPTRLEMYTGGTSGAMVRRTIIDNAGSWHLTPTIASNLVSGANAAFLSSGAFFAGGGLTYSSNQPTAGNFSVDASGNVVLVGSLTMGTTNVVVSAYNSTDTEWRFSGVQTYGFSGTATGGTNIRVITSLGAGTGNAIASAGVVGQLVYRGFDNTDIVTGAIVRATATQLWTTSASGTKLLFYITANGAHNSVTQGLVIDQDGTVGIGTNATGTSNSAYITSAGATKVASLASSLYLSNAVLTKTADTAFATPTGFTSPTLLTGTTYRFRAVVVCTANNASVGWKLQLTTGGSLTTSALALNFYVVNMTTPAIASAGGAGAITLDAAFAAASTYANGSNYEVIVEGTFTTSHAGTIALQFAQNTGTAATSSTIQAGGFMAFDLIP